MTILPFAARATRLATILLAVLCLAHSAHATRYYVKWQQSGSGSGADWANAIGGLDAALALTNANADADEIWVAANTNAFVPGTFQTGFDITNPVQIYGGFRGNETSLATRAGLFSQTILDGTTTPNGPAEHVISVTSVVGSSGAPGVIVDGFTITGGSGFSVPTDGGGIYSIQSDLRVGNCFIHHNDARDGGGIYFRGGSTTGSSNLLQIRNTELTDNNADLSGGGLYAETAFGKVMNTSFVTNFSEGDGGGVFLTKMASTNTLEFMNCVYWSNIAINDGAGMRLAATGSDLGRAKLVNCTFNMNAAGGGGAGGAIRTSSTTTLQATFQSSIVWDNTPAEWAGSGSSYFVEWSDFNGTVPGSGTAGNINSNPFFQNPSQGRLRLTYSGGNPSPCIDSATDCHTPTDILDVDNDGNTGELVDIDHEGSPRPADDTAADTGDTSCTFDYNDMGAYEFH